MKTLFILFLILSGMNLAASGQTEAILSVQKKPQKIIRGAIKDPNYRVIPGALVELYTHPEHAWDKWQNIKDQGADQERVRQCITGEDRKFSFTGLEKGDYELRVDVEGYKRQCHLFKYRSHSLTGTNKDMEIVLRVAT